MTDINNTGTLGVTGIPSFDPAIAGTAGGAGGDAAPPVNNAAGAINTEEATGGAGGAGGNGAANPAGLGGAAGAGGAGGAATASTVTTQPSSIVTAPDSATATATGGAGGAAGTPGNARTATSGPGANGGVGGTATAYAIAANSLVNLNSLASATATSIGGTGGSGYGIGYLGGAGGAASIAGVTATGFSAAATASATGGNGGAGLGGAGGGSGANTVLTNAVTGSTGGGTLNLKQTATGGAGGKSAATAGGAGGNASSALTFNDSLVNLTASAALTGGAIALGGAGGASGGLADGAAGGAAVSSTAFTGANSVRAFPLVTPVMGAVGAAGGAGGAASGTGNGGTGGTATTSASAVSTSIANNVDTSASAVAQGGAGGTAVNGNGGAGGAVTGARALAVEAAETANLIPIFAKGGAVSSFNDVTAIIGAIAQEIGGGGGTGTGIGHTGGTGGAASGAFATATGYDARAIATQTGGHGGLGFAGANGGTGGDSVLTNGVAGTATGRSLTLTQTSIGGAGGDSNGGNGGNGGAGIANLTYDETASASQPLGGTTISNNATGGLGGGAVQLGAGAAGKGGTATATATVTGSSFVDVGSTATGGAGGIAQGVGGTGGQGGDANATASAIVVPGPATTGVQDFIALATAVGGAGGAGLLGATNGLMGNANASASATGVGGVIDAEATATGTLVSAHTAAATSKGVVTNATANTSSTGGSTIAGFSSATSTAGGVPNPLGNSSVSIASADMNVMPGLGFLGTQPGQVSAVLGANPKATILAQGTESAKVTKATTGPQSLTSTETFTLAASSLSGALVLDLSTGSTNLPDVASLEFTVSVAGVMVLDKTFTDAASATVFFTNDALDLGAVPQVDGTQVSISTTISLAGPVLGFGDTYADGFVLGTTGGGTPPAISGPVTASTLDSGGVITLDALANASDANPAAVLSVIDLPTSLPAFVTFNAATHSFTLNPVFYESLAPGQTQNLTVNYAVTDGTTIAPASTVFTVIGTNQAPVVVRPLAFTLPDDSPVLAFDPLANVFDPDAGQVLTLIPGTLPTGLHLLGTGAAFDPSDPAFATLQFGQSSTVIWNYNVTDGIAIIPDSTSFTVTGIEHPPVISGPVSGGTVLESAAPVTLNLLANATDTNPLAVLNVDTALGETVSVTSGSWNQPIAFSVANNQLTIDPSQFATLALGQTLGLTFNYQVTDGNPGGSVPASANVAIQGLYAGPTGVVATDSTAALAKLVGGGLNAKVALATFAETGGLAGDTYTYGLGGTGAGTAFTLATAGNVATLSTGNSSVAGTSGGQLFALNVTATDTTAGISAPAATVDVVIGSGHGNNTINLASIPGIVASAPTFIYDLGGTDSVNAAAMTGPLWIEGGQGADTMTGGSGLNDYVYSATADSTPTAMDIIANFHAAMDLLDFTGLGTTFGPVVALAANATSLAAHSIGWQANGGNTFVYANTGGGATALTSANMKIELQGTVPLTSGNFAHL